MDQHETTAQAAERHHVSVRGIHRLISQHGLIAAAKLPGRTGAYLFDPADVDAAFERKRASRKRDVAA